MRVTIALAFVVSMLVGSPAPATEPPPADVQPAAAPVATVAKTDPGKPEFTADEKDLLSRGYKLKMRDGEKWFCKREATLGSHFEQIHCNTVESIMSQRAASRETVREIQANKPELNK